MRYFFSLILTFLTIAISNLSAQVDFVADKVEGCGILTVKFNPVTTELVQKYFWDFGNGKTSLQATPTVTYTQAGEYTVKLTVNDSSVAIIKSNYIKVRHLPDARFIIVDSVNTGPFIYNLYATRQPVDTFTYSFAWIFSDDSTATGPIVFHQFNSSGIYNATLKVTDDFGCVDSVHHIIVASTKIVVPNVFTPNGDLKNDVLEIQTNGKSSYLFTVYSSSGMVVFKLESVFIRWGGENISGEKLNSGIYYFTLESLDPGNPSSQSGFIYLLR
jgi:gliding motility-associated-like protein